MAVVIYLHSALKYLNNATIEFSLVFLMIVSVEELLLWIKYPMFTNCHDFIWGGGQTAPETQTWYLKIGSLSG